MRTSPEAGGGAIGLGADWPLETDGGAAVAGVAII